MASRIGKPAKIGGRGVQRKRLLDAATLEQISDRKPYGKLPLNGSKDQLPYAVYCLLEFLAAAKARGRKYVPYAVARDFVNDYWTAPDSRDRAIRYASRLGFVEILNRNKQASKRIYITETIGLPVLSVYRAYFADK